MNARSSASLGWPSAAITLAATDWASSAASRSIAPGRRAPPRCLDRSCVEDVRVSSVTKARTGSLRRPSPGPRHPLSAPGVPAHAAPRVRSVDVRVHPSIRGAVAPGRRRVTALGGEGSLEPTADDVDEPLGVLELGCVTDALEHGRARGWRGGPRRRGRSSTLTRRSSSPCRRRVGRAAAASARSVSKLAGELLEQGAGCVGVGGRGLGVGVPLGREEHQAAAQRGVEPVRRRAA